jgi:hypothetical protein
MPGVPATRGCLVGIVSFVGDYVALGTVLFSACRPADLQYLTGRRGKGVSHRTQCSTVDQEAAVNVQRPQHGQRT